MRRVAAPLATLARDACSCVVFVCDRLPIRFIKHPSVSVLDLFCSQSVPVIRRFDISATPLPYYTPVCFFLFKMILIKTLKKFVVILFDIKEVFSESLINVLLKDGPEARL